MKKTITLIILTLTTCAFAQGNPIEDERLNASAYALAIDLFGKNGEKNIKHDGNEHRFMHQALQAVRAKFSDNELLSSAWKFATIGRIDKSLGPGEVYSRYYFAALSRSTSLYTRSGGPWTEQSTVAYEKQNAARTLLEGCRYIREFKSYEYRNYSKEDRLIFVKDKFDIDMNCKNQLIEKLRALGIRKIILNKTFYNVPITAEPLDTNLESISTEVIADAFGYNDMPYIKKQMQKISGLEMFSELNPQPDSIIGTPEALAMDIKLKDQPDEDLESGLLNSFTLIYHPDYFDSRTTEVQVTPIKNSDGTYSFELLNLGQFPTVQQLLDKTQPGEFGYIGETNEGKECRISVLKNYTNPQGKKGALITLKEYGSTSIEIPLYEDTIIDEVYLSESEVKFKSTNIVAGNEWSRILNVSSDNTGNPIEYSATQLLNFGNGNSSYKTKNCKKLRLDTK